jgi:hypothetical protein
MKGRGQIYLWIVLLTVLGLGLAIYKFAVLGFPVIPGARTQVWTVEAKISFDGQDKGVIAALNLPDVTGNMTVIQTPPSTPGYGYHVEQIDGEAWGIWSKRKASGRQTIRYKTHIYHLPGDTLPGQDEPPGELPDDAAERFDEQTLPPARALIEYAHKRSADGVTFATALLTGLKTVDSYDEFAPFKPRLKTKSETARLLLDLLTLGGIPARTIRGLRLGQGDGKVAIARLIEVWDEDHWTIIDPAGNEVGLPDGFLVWQHGDSALLEVTGGKKSKLSFSVITNERLAKDVALYLGEEHEAALVNFSIYSLPVEAQNAFAMLLLIPLGALVVVILRNLVGISTSGTFMPILITLVFLQTSLVTGLILFLIVVSIGLAIRSYLSRLNLLLVPRISAVLVVVILLYVGISVASYKMGIQSGLAVTFFPMVIIAWTIERLSILWEEEGPHEVLVQGGGSLFTAVIAYFVMSNHFIGHLIFNFPELLLVVLAIILLIGNYSGYRLTELRRFEPMGRE